MGVYIKGMKMPQNCWDCTVARLADCDINVYIPSSDYREERFPGCPLVEVPTYVGLKEELDEWVKHFPNNEETE